MESLPYSDAYLVTGGRPLSGNVRVSGAKNMALKAIIAALLFDHPVTLTNVPRINDVFSLFELITSIGGTVKFTDENTAVVDGRTISEPVIDLLHAAKTRVSFMLFAPLLHGLGECSIPNPGGCRLGARPIDRIIEGMISLGISVSYSSETGYYSAKRQKHLTGTYRFTKPSHTGTELLIMLAAINDGTVTIENAAKEPEIDDLIRFLVQGGARITRDGDAVHITGVSSLTTDQPFEIPGDRNEAVSFAVLGLATNGIVTVEGVEPDVLSVFVDHLRQTGADVRVEGGDAITFSAQKKLRPVSITTAPHPGFMTDWQPGWAILMTQAHGDSYIHETVFENRFAYVDELKKLGAHITFEETSITDREYFFTPEPGREYRQRITIHGPQIFHNGVLHIADLRAGATLVTAALLAEGESVIHGAAILNRGYERLPEKIRALGGTIREV